MNTLDRKPIKNVLAGKNAKKKTGNPLARPRPGNLTGVETGDTTRVRKNPLAFPVSRHGLVWRSVQDGVNLIESIGKAVKE